MNRSLSLFLPYLDVSSSFSEGFRLHRFALLCEFDVSVSARIVPAAVKTPLTNVVS